MILMIFCFYFQVEFIDFVVKGIFNVLNLCIKVFFVKRVVVIFFMVVVVYNGKLCIFDVIVDEIWFFDLEVCKIFKVCFNFEKV